jgi:1-deoxyxylulose-5-phosphate synthase
MKNLTRRAFLKTSLATATTLAAAPTLTYPQTKPADLSPVRRATDRVFLGRTGIKVSRLVQGTGVHGGGHASDHTQMGQKAFTELIRHGFDQGINFWDMADLYGTHPLMKNAMNGVPRDQYVTLSKIWTRQESWVKPSGGAIAEVDRFRKELGIERLDICLIHCMVNAQWPEEKKRVRDELSELKQKGAVRAVGISCHDHGALKVAATDPWVDVIFARINYKGGKEYLMDGTSAEISQTLKTARAHGKAVVGMKIFGEGKLIQPQEKDASLRYVLGHDLVDAMTIGMRKIEEVDDSIRRINQTLRA